MISLSTLVRPRKRLAWDQRIPWRVGATAWMLALVVTGTLKSAPPPPNHTDSTTHKASAPWGTLEFTRIELERPEDSFPLFTASAPLIRWFFAGYAPEQLPSLMAESGLTKNECERLLVDGRVQKTRRGSWILPPRDLVLQMNASVRGQLYAVLARSAENSQQRDPWRMATNRLDAWLADLELSPTVHHTFKRLIYYDGPEACFSDGEALESVCSPQEARALAQAISRVPALMVRLQVGPDSDIDALVEYWGRAGRGLQARPMLEALSRCPDGSSIDVSFFFPSYMRNKLHTFPIPKEDDSPNPDCYWTAMNFHNSVPDDRFFDGATTWGVLQTNYEPVQGEKLFGDLLLLVDEQGQTIHMCIQVADDIVFTKNGVSIYQPWILGRFGDMIDRYRSEKPNRLLVFRRKL